MNQAIAVSVEKQAISLQEQLIKCIKIILKFGVYH